VTGLQQRRRGHLRKKGHTMSVPIIGVKGELGYDNSVWGAYCSALSICGRLGVTRD
jgi:hypothetical protein